MINHERLGDFLAYQGRLPQTKKEYASFVLFKGVKKWTKDNWTQFLTTTQDKDTKGNWNF